MLLGCYCARYPRHNIIQPTRLGAFVWPYMYPRPCSIPPPPPLVRPFLHSPTAARPVKPVSVEQLTHCSHSNLCGCCAPIPKHHCLYAGFPPLLYDWLRGQLRRYHYHTYYGKHWHHIELGTQPTPQSHTLIGPYVSIQWRNCDPKLDMWTPR